MRAGLALISISCYLTTLMVMRLIQKPSNSLQPLQKKKKKFPFSPATRKFLQRADCELQAGKTLFFSPVNAREDKIDRVPWTWLSSVTAVRQLASSTEAIIRNIWQATEFKITKNKIVVKREQTSYCTYHQGSHHTTNKIKKHTFDACLSL